MVCVRRLKDLFFHLFYLFFYFPLYRKKTEAQFISNANDDGGDFPPPGPVSSLLYRLYTSVGRRRHEFPDNGFASPPERGCRGVPVLGRVIGMAGRGDASLLNLSAGRC